MPDKIEATKTRVSDGYEYRSKPNRFSLTPYGDNLCTPGAKFWIRCVTIVVFIMATAEAVSWGYLGSRFSAGITGYIAGGVAFLCIFFIIWVIDASFVTLDLSRAFYEKVIFKKEDTDYRQDMLKLISGLSGRVLIVFVSLYLSAPFLSQIIFNNDVVNEMDRQNAEALVSVRDSLQRGYDSSIDSLNTLIADQQKKAEAEAAGTGGSGRYGRGDAVITIEREITRLRDEVELYRGEKGDLLTRFDTTDTKVLARVYAVEMLEEGVQSRGRILDQLMDNPDYRTAKHAITAFLAFIFAALILLKLFQPRSIKIYYNEQMQDLYGQYLSGRFDLWLSNVERPEGGKSKMHPLRFEDWCINTYSVIRDEDIKRRDSSIKLNAHIAIIEQLTYEKKSVEGELEPLQKEYNTIVDSIQEDRVRNIEIESDLEDFNQRHEDLVSEIARLNQKMRDGEIEFDLMDGAQRVKRRLESERGDVVSQKRKLVNEKDTINLRIAPKNTQLTSLSKRIEIIQESLHDIQERINAERKKFSEQVSKGEINYRDGVNASTDAHEFKSNGQSSAHDAVGGEKNT